MKKFFLLSAAALFALSANAQSVKTGGLQPGYLPKASPKKAPISLHNNSRDTESRWLNYMSDAANPDCDLGREPVSTLFPLFPDSTLISGWNAAGDTFGVFYHMAATMIEPYNMPCHWLVMGNNYDLDSTAVDYAYIRTTDPSVVDTLVIHIIKQSNNIYGFSDGFIFQAIFFDSINKVLRPNQIIQTYRIPLTEADSTIFDPIEQTFGLKSLDVATPITTLAANARFGAVVEFRPGYSWVPYQDSLFGKNSFWLRSFETNGTDQGQFPGDSIYSLNTSYILPSDVYYNDAESYNGWFIPSWAYGDTYGLEHHAIWFKLTSTNIGVNEVKNEFGHIGTFPNPAADDMKLGVILKEKAENVVVTITDVLGRNVHTINAGDMKVGPTELNISTADFANGVYNCTVVSGNRMSSIKFIVAH